MDFAVLESESGQFPGQIFHKEILILRINKGLFSKPLIERKTTMKYRCFILPIIVNLTLITFFGCAGRPSEKVTPEVSISPENIIFAGVRSSSYGIKPFPEPSEWENAIQTMSGYFEVSDPCAIWIVGEFRRNKACHLYFPSDGRTYPNVEFESFDKHEKYLSYFDDIGIKVYLQVEPASADLATLIDLVLKRYKHHSCVIGFGVDVEWHRESENPEWGIPVDDGMAEAWEKSVKAHNAQYRLFLKHWDRNWMPKNYRGDIIFVDDSQIFKDFDAMLEEFSSYWADYFFHNTVFFQIGYKSDKPWWQKMKNAPEIMGRIIANNVKQKCGIFWVDFTLRDVSLLK